MIGRVNRARLTLLMAAKKKNQRIRRLDEVRPLEVAKTVERSLQRERAKIDEWLSATAEVDEEGIPITKIAAAVKRLTAYAHGDDTSRPAEARNMARKLISEMLSNLTTSVDTDDPAIERIDPYLSELMVICTAVLGRTRISVEKSDVPDAWLAALLSLKTGSIRTYVCLPDKPGIYLERPKGETGLITYESARRILNKKTRELWTE